mmetsp:Transcript_31962/g.63824  ORF Transcript_31962/g.63824 Transcript_31962/m.63824 type:complete len:364 (-) Transcript_31962:247-1338(-)
MLNALLHRTMNLSSTSGVSVFHTERLSACVPVQGIRVHGFERLEHIDAVEVLHGLTKALSHRLLSGAERHAGVVVLLVGLGLALGVADLGLEVIAVLRLVRTDAVPERPLRVSIDVHLDGAGLDRIADVLARRARAAVEDEGARLGVTIVELLGNVLLRVVQDLRLEVDVARVHTVHVAEGSGNGEAVVGHSGERLVDLIHLIGLSVQARRVDVRVVDAVLLATGDAELHLEEQVNLGHALHVLNACGNVLLEGLLGEVKHVRREERLAILLEIVLISLDKAIEPGQPRPHAVVGVQQDRHAIQLGDLAHMQGARNGTGDASSVVGVIGAFAGIELATAARKLDDHRAAVSLGSLEAAADRAG